MMILTMIRSFWRSLLTLLRDNSGEMPVPEMFRNFPDILTIENLQKALGVGRSTAYRLINDGKIRHLRIGKAIKVPKRYLVDFVESSCYTDIVAANLPSEGGK